MYCEYSPQIAGPVIVYHRDTQGRLLEPPEVLTGDINADFEAYALADNVDQVVGDAVQTGQFTGHSQTIRFTYQLNALEAGTPPDQTEYIEVLVPKSVYLDPTATSPLADVLPAHTFWRVYTLMRETVTNQVWLNLGGSQWITADQTQRRHTMAFLHGPDQLALRACILPKPTRRCARWVLPPAAATASRCGQPRTATSTARAWQRQPAQDYQQGRSR